MKRIKATAEGKALKTVKDERTMEESRAKEGKIFSTISLYDDCTFGCYDDCADCPLFGN